MRKTEFEKLTAFEQYELVQQLQKWEVISIDEIEAAFFEKIRNHTIKIELAENSGYISCAKN